HPVTSYMMSAEQQLISDDGRPVGVWRPHIMIYYPWMDDPSPGCAPRDNHRRIRRLGRLSAARRRARGGRKAGGPAARAGARAGDIPVAASGPPDRILHRARA